MLISANFHDYLGDFAPTNMKVCSANSYAHLGEFPCSSRRFRAYKDEGVLGEVAEHRVNLRLVRIHVVAQPVDDHLLLLWCRYIGVLKCRRSPVVVVYTWHAATNVRVRVVTEGLLCWCRCIGVLK